MSYFISIKWHDLKKRKDKKGHSYPSGNLKCFWNPSWGRHSQVFRGSCVFTFREVWYGEPTIWWFVSTPSFLKTGVRLCPLVLEKASQTTRKPSTWLQHWPLPVSGWQHRLPLFCLSPSLPTILSLPQPLISVPLSFSICCNKFPQTCKFITLQLCGVRCPKLIYWANQECLQGCMVCWRLKGGICSCASQLWKAHDWASVVFFVFRGDHLP